MKAFSIMFISIILITFSSAKNLMKTKTKQDCREFGEFLVNHNEGYLYEDKQAEDYRIYEKDQSCKILHEEIIKEFDDMECVSKMGWAEKDGNYEERDDSRYCCY